MPLSILFCHGWGFDAAFWEPLAAHLPEFAQVRDDAGYFGAGTAARPTTPYLAVTHSFGTMRLLTAPPPGLAGLVAIAGFDRFTATQHFPGVPRRVVDRMVSAVAQEPETVLADFHALFGSMVPSGTPDRERLQADLVGLRDSDMRAQAAAIDVPILSLQAERDTLLAMGLRETVFAAAPRVMRRTHPAAGHLLAGEDPAWCAAAIRAFAGALT
jgi:pimeloyl-[acyl-carrier protein] methyl ester esterase